MPRILDDAGNDAGGDAASDATSDGNASDSGNCIAEKSCAPGTWHLIAPSPLEGRARFGFAWSGSELFVAGGRTSDFMYRDGARYDPSSDSWKALPLFPDPITVRYDMPLVYTGAEVAFWSGGEPIQTPQNGARFSIANAAWSLISSAGAPGGRVNHALVYDATDNALIVWGGFPYSDGARFSLASGVWSALPAAPISDREQFAYAWDAVRRYLYVFGGAGPKDDGAIFDAAKNSWSVLPPVPSGFAGRRLLPGVVAEGKFVIWGGQSDVDLLSDGLIYDPTASSWTPISPSPLEARASHLAVTDGKRVFYFGGTGNSLFADGAIFDLGANTWAPRTEAPHSGREQLGGAWTPSGIVVWGGTAENDGALYVP